MQLVDSKLEDASNSPELLPDKPSDFLLRDHCSRKGAGRKKKTSIQLDVESDRKTINSKTPKHGFRVNATDEWNQRVIDYVIPFVESGKARSVNQFMKDCIDYIVNNRINPYD
jgi:hypothetical protein